MTEEWVSHWYQCLTQNIDYSLYCDARDSGNEVQCAAYEARFDRVRDIYDDFGTLDGWPDAGMQSALWQEWFEPRRQGPTSMRACLIQTRCSPPQLKLRSDFAGLDETHRAVSKQFGPGRDEVWV